MPGGVFQRGIDMGPAARVIDEDHEGDRGAAENIEGIKALIHPVKVREIRKWGRQKQGNIGVAPAKGMRWIAGSNLPAGG